MKFLSQLAVLIPFLFSCTECEEIECRGVNQSVVDRIPHKSITDISFSDGQDSALHFTQIFYSQSDPKIIECNKSWAGCSCASCDPSAGAANSYSSNKKLIIPYQAKDSRSWLDTINGIVIRRDTSYFVTRFFEFDSYFISAYDNEEDTKIRLQYNFLDCRNYLDFQRDQNNDFQFLADIGDSVLVNFVTPKDRYSNVIKSEFEVRYTGITTIYFSMTDGVVAFRDSSNVLFYRD